MKKIMFALMMAMTVSAATYAQKQNDKAAGAAKEIAQSLQNAPSGTSYGIVEVTKSHIVINSPLGRHTINRNADGSYVYGCYSSTHLFEERGLQNKDFAGHVYH